MRLKISQIQRLAFFPDKTLFQGKVYGLFKRIIQVVLASMASLEVGYSHDIFVEWATEAKNLVLFTEKGQVQRNF